MAYNIHYRSENQSSTPRSKLRLFLFTLMFFTLFMLMAMHFIPEQLQTLHDIVFGQDNVETLLQDLRDGEPITEAVNAFCQGVLNGK